MRVYTTISGDAWDLIAFRVYDGVGGESLTSRLIEANPEHIETVIFPAGVRLIVPDVPLPVPETLPPWMRT